MAMGDKQPVRRYKKAEAEVKVEKCAKSPPPETTARCLFLIAFAQP
jgi:hypothetical protein